MKGIYQYTDLKNDEVIYVGKDSSIDKNRRHYEHKAPSRYDEQQINRIIQNNPDRYQYDVICQHEYLTDDELNYLEIKEILKHKFLYDEKPKFNFSIGGEGNSGWNHTEETKRKISESCKGRTGYWKSKHLSDETKQKLSEANKGKILSDETKQKISKNSAKYWEGKTLSDEHKQKISETKKGTTLTDEHKIKMSKAHNTSGYYRVSQCKNKKLKQGFSWRYSYYEDGKNNCIESVDIKKLESKVKAHGLPWKKLKEGDKE